MVSTDFFLVSQKECPYKVGSFNFFVQNHLSVSLHNKSHALSCKKESPFQPHDPHEFHFDNRFITQILNCPQYPLLLTLKEQKETLGTLIITVHYTLFQI